MTSINTNIAAQTALRTLQSTNAQLDQTQSRISTGLKIGEAKDNAAYWSISTTLRSDNKALGTVKDALALGAATVDVAYQGLNATLSVLDEMKSKLTVASAGNVDKKAVQADIKELQNQLRAIAESATFSGENWLQVNSTATGFDANKTIVSAFNRAAGGAVSLDTMDVAISNFVLIDNGTDKTGVLETAILTAAVKTVSDAITALTEVAGTNGTGTPPTGATGGTATLAFSGPLTFGASDKMVVSIAANGGAATSIVINQAVVNSALSGVTDGRIADEAAMKLVFEKAIQNANLSGITVSTGTDQVILTGTAASAGTGGTLAVSSTASAVSGVLDFDVTKMDRTEIEAFITNLSGVADKITAGATTLGAIAKRIDLQQTFVSNLMDTIDKGVSGLVDADMNEESTRLQALQVKQQLGVQALSIANQSAQNVLRLFQ